MRPDFDMGDISWYDSAVSLASAFQSTFIVFSALSMSAAL